MKSRKQPVTLLRYMLLIVWAACGAVAEAGVEITYTGNEGFLIAAAGKKILIDAVYRKGVPGYVVMPEERQMKIEEGQPPFDGVDLILATHSHPDHFDADAVTSLLQSNPDAFFVSTEQAVKKLQQTTAWTQVSQRALGFAPKEGKRIQLRLNGIELELLKLHHGREVPAQNLGFLIWLGEKKLLHVGDTEASLADFEIYNLQDDRIDIAFIPFWYLTDPDRKKIISAGINPKRIVAMHIPPPSADDEYIESLGGWDKMVKGIESDFPGIIVFREEMASVNID